MCINYNYIYIILVSIKEKGNFSTVMGWIPVLFKNLIVAEYLIPQN